ncbi:MAG: adenylosuccinate synthase [Candidatus Omnitrophica bacterium]|nr:adenylosuccinate synthase [Candidatus Omnitrophota bacterium]
MMNIVVVGAQWGDEGKGKLIDILSKDVDVTVRYQGGSNAGHTVIVGKEQYVFHLLPSAILRKGKVCVIGNGVVVDPKALLDEIDGLRRRGIKVSPDQLKIAVNSHVVMPYHRILDGLREKMREHKIGTTGRGIGPCYADKVTRCGIRMVDLLNPRVFAAKLKDNLREKNEYFKKVFGQGGFHCDDIYQEYLPYARRLRPYVCDTALYVNAQIDKKKSVLFEGAQGAFLDIDFGTYPFVTSSNTTVGGVASGSGVAPTKIDKVIAAVKAYTTRVGEGPFPTEFDPKMDSEIRTKGKEFGATTGRARRCGWFDSVLVRYAATIGGFNELAIMKLDVLDELKTIRLCKAYKYKGKIFRDFSHDYEAICQAKPVYEQMPGWCSPIGKVRQYKNLPARARAYVERMEDLVGVPIKYISIGSERDEIIVR